MDKIKASSDYYLQLSLCIQLIFNDRLHCVTDGGAH